MGLTGAKLKEIWNINVIAALYRETGDWYINVLKKYAVFSGRACREEFWYFILYDIIIGLTLGLLTLIPIQAISTVFVGLSFIYSLGTIVPTLAVTVRRLHDIDRGALSLFYILIPLAGFIILILFLARKGTQSENQYDTNKERRVTPLLIMLALVILAMQFYFSYKGISSGEMFAIFNMSNNNYYLNVSTEKEISLFSFKRYEQINDTKYTNICKTGRYKLNEGIIIFRCERNDAGDIYIKLKSIFDEFEVFDENNNVIWDLNNDNIKITRIEGFFNSVFWILTLK